MKKTNPKKPLKQLEANKNKSKKQKIKSTPTIKPEQNKRRAMKTIVNIF